MNYQRRTTIALLLSVATAAAHAETVPSRVADDLRVIAEVDAIPFAFKGYSGWLGLSPRHHWGVYLGVASGQPPNLFGDAGWTTRIRSLEVLRVEYYENDDNSGFSPSLAVGRIGWQFGRDDLPGASGEQDQMLVFPQLGYTWYPTHAGVFVEPLAGVGLAYYTVGPDVVLGTHTFHAPRVVPIALLLVGFAFGH